MDVLVFNAAATDQDGLLRMLFESVNHSVVAVRMLSLGYFEQGRSLLLPV